MRNCRIRLSLRLACGRSWHHRFSVMSLWVLANTKMKCSLKFQMACSAELLWWVLGGTNWIFSFTSLITFLSTFWHSLSRMCRLGFKLLLVKRLCSLWYGVFNSSHVHISKAPYEWCLNHNGRPPIYIFFLFWMWLENLQFDKCKISLSNPLSW